MSKPSKFGARLGRVPWSYWLDPRCWFHRTPRLAHDFYSPAPSFLVCAKAIHHLCHVFFWFLWFPQGHLFHGYLYSVSNYFNVLLMFVIFMGMCMNFHLFFFAAKQRQKMPAKHASWISRIPMGFPWMSIQAWSCNCSASALNMWLPQWWKFLRNFWAQ